MVKRRHNNILAVLAVAVVQIAVRPTNPNNCFAAAANCEKSCEDEWPNCVRFHGGGGGCDSCKTELDDANSQLVNQGQCTVGCTPTNDMMAICDDGEDDNNNSSSEDNNNNNEDNNNNNDPKPVVPTECNEDNRGSCECGDPSKGVVTYVFWPGGTTDGEPGPHQRCIHTHVPEKEKTEPLPVLVSVNGYGQGLFGANSAGVRKADHYGYALLGMGSTGPDDGAGKFRLEFPANGVVNPSNPTPCSATDSRDYRFVEGFLDFIRDDPALDESRVYLEGFSQSSMWSAYVAVCFADRVAGLWQGGSGLAKTGHAPVTPGWQSQCSLSDYLDHGKDCCSSHYCEDCAWWPIYPRTCGNKIVDCIASYTNDNIACGSDYYMYEAMVTEGNDARLLSFSPSSGVSGGHSNPQNKYDWMVGCLGIVDSCSGSCEDSFENCVVAGTGSGGDFSSCFDSMANGDLAGCDAGCAPTLGMMKLSGEPVVASLSEGKFGTQTGLPSAGDDDATRPVCQNEFGSFDDENVDHESKCNPPSFAIPPETDDIKQCPAVTDDDDDNDDDETCENVEEFEWKKGKFKKCDSKWLKKKIKKKGLKKICKQKAKPSKLKIKELCPETCEVC